MNDRVKFAIMMAEMASAFDLGAPSKDKTAVYHKYLSDIPIDALGRGFTRVIKSHKGPGLPSVAQIREAALGLDEDTMSDRGIEAWREACRRLALMWPAQNPSASDLVHQSVLMAFGSWQGFSETDPGKEGFDRSHFIKCWRAVAKRNSGLMLGPGAGGEKKLLTNGPDEPK